MRQAKVTVFPVPVTRPPAPESADPARMTEEIERLRAENSVLRERLAAVQTIALEREETIEDLRHALQMLPSVWAKKLQAKLGPTPKPAAHPPAAPAKATRAPTESQAGLDHPAEAAAPSPEAEAAARSPEAEAPGDPAEILFAEVAALRARLERKRLEAEMEILEQERRRLLADIDWTRRWRRARRPVQPTT